MRLLMRRFLDGKPVEYGDQESPAAPKSCYL